MFIPVDDKNHTVIWNDHDNTGKDENVLNTICTYALLKKKQHNILNTFWLIHIKIKKNGRMLEFPFYIPHKEFYLIWLVMNLRL